VRCSACAKELVAGLLRPRLFPCGKLSKLKSAAQLWIYIGFNSYPDPAFLVNADLDPGFDDPKIEQNVKLKQICCIFFLQKLQLTYPLVPSLETSKLIEK
jgi:hypothetical protein